MTFFSYGRCSGCGKWRKTGGTIFSLGKKKECYCRECMGFINKGWEVNPTKSKRKIKGKYIHPDHYTEINGITGEEREVKWEKKEKE